MSNRLVPALVAAAATSLSFPYILRNTDAGTGFGWDDYVRVRPARGPRQRSPKAPKVMRRRIANRAARKARRINRKAA